MAIPAKRASGAQFPAHLAGGRDRAVLCGILLDRVGVADAARRLAAYVALVLYLAFVERQIRYSRAISPAVSSTA